ARLALTLDSVMVTGNECADLATVDLFFGALMAARPQATVYFTLTGAAWMSTILIPPAQVAVKAPTPWEPGVVTVSLAFWMTLENGSVVRQPGVGTWPAA